MLYLPTPASRHERIHYKPTRLHTHTHTHTRTRTWMLDTSRSICFCAVAPPASTPVTWMMEALRPGPPGVRPSPVSGGWMDLSTAASESKGVVEAGLARHRAARRNARGIPVLLQEVITNQDKTSLHTPPHPKHAWCLTCARGG